MDDSSDISRFVFGPLQSATEISQCCKLFRHISKHIHHPLRLSLATQTAMYRSLMRSISAPSVPTSHMGYLLLLLLITCTWGCDVALSEIVTLLLPKLQFLYLSIPKHCVRTGRFSSGVRHLDWRKGCLYFQGTLSDSAGIRIIISLPSLNTEDALLSELSITIYHSFTLKIQASNSSRNTDNDLPDYTASHSRRLSS
jgi:hypothetical protein